MRRWRKRIISQARTGLCASYTNSGFTFLNSSYPQLLVDMLLALVQRLSWARISRQFACVSFDGIMRRCMKRIILQVLTGLFPFSTNSVFKFLNSPYPQLLVDMLLAVVQRLFWARISRQLAWISIDDILRCCMKRIISQVRTGLYAFCTNSVFTFLNSPHLQLLVAVLLALVQRLFRARVSRELAWISIDGTMRRWKKCRGSLPVCALFAQTQCLHFWTPHTLNFL